MIYYKVMNKDGTIYHRDHNDVIKGSLPVKQEDGYWIPGKWMPKIPGVAAGALGYSVFTLQQLPNFFSSVLFEVEGRGEHIEGTSQLYWQETRLLRRIDSWSLRAASLYACDCAEQVMDFFVREYPQERTPLEAISYTRGGSLTDGELECLAKATAGICTRILIDLKEVYSHRKLAATQAASAAAFACASAYSIAAVQEAMDYARLAFRREAIAHGDSAADDLTDKKPIMSVIEKQMWDWQMARLQDYLADGTIGPDAPYGMKGITSHTNNIRLKYGAMWRTAPEVKDPYGNEGHKW